MQRHARSLLRLACAGLCACSALLAPATAAAPARLVQSLTFAAIKNQPQQRLTLFYFDGDAGVQELRDTVEEVAQSLSTLADFSFAAVDCSLVSNAAECGEAGFSRGSSWLFTSLLDEGIVAYTGPRDPASISRHIHHKFLPADPRLVHTFVSEVDLFERMDSLTTPGQSPKPMFVKFWESWCTHCKALKHTFDQAALYFSPQVDFLAVECSSSDSARSFCSFNNATAFPTLVLFDGEAKILYRETERNIHAFHKFFLANLPQERFSPVREKRQQQLKKRSSAASTNPAAAVSATPRKSDDATGDESSASSKKKASTQAPKQKKQLKKDEEEEEEEQAEKDAAAPRKRRKKSASQKSAASNSKKARQDEEKDEEEDEDEEPTDTPALSTRQQRRLERRKRWKAQRAAEAKLKQHDEL